MDAKKKKKIIIWVSLTMLLGVGGYFAYTKLIKPKLDERKAKKAAEEMVTNAREIMEIVSKSSTQASEVLSKRFNQAISEISEIAGSVAPKAKASK
jgi:hypothetical protein